MNFIIAVHKYKNKKPMVFIADSASATVCQSILPQKAHDTWELFELEADEINVVKDESQIRKILIEESKGG